MNGYTCPVLKVTDAAPLALFQLTGPNCSASVQVPSPSSAGSGSANISLCQPAPKPVAEILSDTRPDTWLRMASNFALYFANRNTVRDATGWLALPRGARPKTPTENSKFATPF